MKRFLIALVLSACANAVHANIIDDVYGSGAGSFELGSFVNGGGGDVLPLPGIDYMGVAAGDSTTITGWSVGGPGTGVDWLIEPFFGADTGVHSLDLQHTIASSISTVIPTVTGEIYELSFAAATVSGRDSLGTVTAGSLVSEPFSAIPSAAFSNQAFTPYSFLFTATGPTTTITFTGTGNSFYGPVIDTVSVISPVPLPAAVWLFGSGLLGLFGISRHKKA